MGSWLSVDGILREVKESIRGSKYESFGRNSVLNIQSSEGVTFGAYFTPI
jgi:hypothetical protein